MSMCRHQDLLLLIFIVCLVCVCHGSTNYLPTCGSYVCTLFFWLQENKITVRTYVAATRLYSNAVSNYEYCYSTVV